MKYQLSLGEGEEKELVKSKIQDQGQPWIANGCLTGHASIEHVP